MIQFNLLPDVKAEYIKARRTKRLVIFISTIVGLVSVTIFLLLLVAVDVVQKKELNDANSKISSYSKQVKAVPDLDKILTVQNQLDTLTKLHDDKAVSSRLFTFIEQVTPTQASISALNIDFTQNTLSITGEAPSLDVVNAYTDTLKATTYKTDSSDTDTTPAFSAVVLSAFGRDSKGATYTITLNFDPLIFSSTNKSVTLVVPKTVAGTQQELFQKQAGS